MLKRFTIVFTAVALLATVFPPSASIQAQDNGYLRARARTMLRDVKKDIEENYYDPKFHGLDIKTLFEQADEEIKRAITDDQMNGIIARTLLEFNDSHTAFFPPAWNLFVDYGWRMQIFGAECLVTEVSPESDAAAKGLKVGDRILTVFDVPVSRENVEAVRYLFFAYDP